MTKIAADTFMAMVVIKYQNFPLVMRQVEENRRQGRQSPDSEVCCSGAHKQK
jgi:hypothetical protein